VSGNAVLFISENGICDPRLNATRTVLPNAYQRDISRKDGKQIAAIPIAIATPEHITTNGKVDSRIDIVIAH